MASQLCEFCAEAQRYFNAGDFASARATATAIHTGDPSHHEVLFLLGALAFVAGDVDCATALNGRAVRELGDSTPLAVMFAQGFVGISVSLLSQQETAKATSALRIAVLLCPADAAVHTELGNVLLVAGDANAALASFEHALALQPQHAPAWHSMGSLYMHGPCRARAVHCFTRAVYASPDCDRVSESLAAMLGGAAAAAVLVALGHLLRDETRFEHAILTYQRALALNPECSGAVAGIATVLHRAQKLPEAAAHYAEALRLAPNAAENHSNMGHIHRDLQNLLDARVSFANAVRLNPASADDMFHLATVCKEVGLNHDATDCFRAALRLRPDDVNVLCSLSHSLQLVCDWTGYDDRMVRLVALATQQVDAGAFPGVHPHHAFLYPLPPRVQRAIGAAHGRAAMTAVALLRRAPFVHVPAPLLGRLRVGFVSSDFKDHPTAHLMQSIPAFIDRSRVELFCYSLAPSDNSRYRRKIEAGAEHFVELSGYTDIGLAAHRIRDDDIHVLLNLNGYTRGARNELFALHPAPVQAMWLGYPGTSGVPFMEYIVTDEVTSPLGELAQGYSEKFVYMPHTFFVGDHAHLFPLPATAVRASPAHAPLPAPVGDVVPPQPPLTRLYYGLPEDKVVLCNFNQLYKLDPHMFAAWLRILQQAPNTILWLLRFPAAGETNLRREAAAAGVAQDRLVFSNVAGKIEHVRRGALADLCLDTRACNGHTTSMDALWGGAPVVTCPGYALASRVAASQVTALGCPELVAPDLDTYVALVVRLARDPDALALLQAKVRRARATSPLFNTQLYTRHLEAACTAMYARHALGAAPDLIRVPLADTAVAAPRAPSPASPTCGPAVIPINCAASTHG